MLLPGPIIIATCMVLASAVPHKRQLLETLSSDQVSGYSPYTYYAAAVKCKSFMSWTCGVNCNNNPHFLLLTGGGDGNAVQQWYVGYDPIQDTVIVAHQGTNKTETYADLTDLNVVPTSIDTSLFPGAPPSIMLHSGFALEHSRTASDVYNAVNQVISTHGASTVTTVGHSLGGALAMLDAMSLRRRLPSNIGVRFIGYGTPRVGNEAWANFVDTQLPGNVTRINNRKDPIPVVPGMFMGYHHPSGEIHVQGDTGSEEWVECPGQENSSAQCSDGSVKAIFSGNLADHDGPYNGILLRC